MGWGAGAPPKGLDSGGEIVTAPPRVRILGGQNGLPPHHGGGETTIFDDFPPMVGGKTTIFLSPHRGGGGKNFLSPHGGGEIDPIAPPDFFCLGGHLPPQTLRIWGGNDLVPPHYGGGGNTTHGLTEAALSLRNPSGVGPCVSYVFLCLIVFLC